MTLVLLLAPACVVPPDHDREVFLSSLVGPAAVEDALGTLVVRTDTREVREDAVVYHVHRPYELLDRDGKLLRTVRNSVGMYDEAPTPVLLAAGHYHVRIVRDSRTVLIVEVVIEAARRTVVDVETLDDVVAPVDRL